MGSHIGMGSKSQGKKARKDSVYDEDEFFEKLKKKRFLSPYEKAILRV